MQPLADPAIWAQLPRLLLAGDSPLKLRLQWDLDQWRWGLRFLDACHGGASRSTTAQLLALAARSRVAFERWQEQQAACCDFSATGKLVLHSTEAAFAAVRRHLELQQRLGTEQYAVDADDCVRIEPALHHYRGRIAGAVHERATAFAPPAAAHAKGPARRRRAGVGDRALPGDGRLASPRRRPLSTDDGPRTRWAFDAMRLRMPAAQPSCAN